MKSVKVYLLTLMAVLFCCGAANAEVNCLSATITKVGIYSAAPTAPSGNAGSNFMLKLDCADDTKWSGERQFMIAASNDAEAMYASALTAVSLKEPVQVLVEGAAEWWSLITTLYYIPAP